MAQLKRKTLTLSTGKQIKMYGISIGISNNLEIGEGYTPNIFSAAPEHLTGKSPEKAPVPNANPYQLSSEELQELADFNIRLWLDFKENLRQFGPDSPKIFSRDTAKS
jgi:hypothetical protein